MVISVNLVSWNKVTPSFSLRIFSLVTIDTTWKKISEYSFRSILKLSFLFFRAARAAAR